jgi:putative transposase
VNLCRRSGKSACQVARELGIPQPTFNRWMQQAATAPLGAKSFLATEELKVLRRELAQVRMERDITYVPTRQGWLYVAVLMDLYSRRIVGWAMDDQATTTLTLRALEMALQQRSVPVGLLHHSDRGSQYGAVAYQQRLAACGIQCSMSRPGNCWDNAVVESFFATLKTELLVNAHPYPTQQDVRTAIFEYVEGFYNRSRRHSTLGYLSPGEFEQRAAQSTSGVH